MEPGGGRGESGGSLWPGLKSSESSTEWKQQRAGLMWSEWILEDEFSSMWGLDSKAVRPPKTVLQGPTSALTNHRVHSETPCAQEMLRTQTLSQPATFQLCSPTCSHGAQRPCAVWPLNTVPPTSPQPPRPTLPRGQVSITRILAGKPWVPATPPEASIRGLCTQRRPQRPPG